MATKTQITEDRVSEEQSATTTADTKSLHQIIDQIQIDSRHEPQAYLEETEVPHGGE